MRKAIFRDELNYVFTINNVSEYDRDSIISSIFENHLEISKQYILKEDMQSITDLNNKVDEIIKDVAIQGAIKTLFIVQDDLILPPELERLFLVNKKVAVFAGAGLSKQIGLPLWEELANNAIQYLVEKNYINYFEYQKIQNEAISPKQRITIFHDFIPKESPEAKEFYDDKLSNKNNKPNPYEILLQFDWIKITSNIDNEFYKAHYKIIPHALVNNTTLPLLEIAVSPKKLKKITHSFSDKTEMNFDTIYHIHGSLDNLGETVLTTKDYVEAYYGDDNGLRNFLGIIFREYHVVFIGYRLEEFELLERILHGSKNNLKRYVLLHTYLNELNFFRIQQKYFKKLGIEPIRYYLDFNGYDRLLTVLNSWLQQLINKRGRDYYERIQGIDEVLD